MGLPQAMAENDDVCAGQLFCAGETATEFRLNAETLPDPLLATYTNLSEAVTEIPTGLVPAVKGEPETAVNAPVELLMENAETLFDPLFAT